MMDWRFLHPWFLVLAPIPLLWLAWRVWKRDKLQPTVLFSDLAPYAAGGPSLKQRVWTSLPVLRAVVLLLGIVALARPQYGRVESRVDAFGLDIALALDISGSMEYQDFEPNRLEAAKRVLKEFVFERTSDRISVVVFAGAGAILVPPTFDTGAVAQQLDQVRSAVDQRYGSAMPDGTAIGTGLALALDKLKDSTAKSRVVVLLTDGENNAGQIAPLQAAEAAKALGVRVYTIGIGSNGMLQVNRRDAFGRIRQEIIQVTIDEKSLAAIAELTGGRYYNATSEDALRRVYAEIDKLEKTEIETSQYADFDERFMWLWTPALLLLALEFLLRAFWLVRLP